MHLRHASFAQMEPFPYISDQIIFDITKITVFKLSVMKQKEVLFATAFLASSPSEANVNCNYIGFPNMQRLKSAKHNGNKVGNIGKTVKSRELAASEHTLALCNVYLDQNGVTQIMGSNRKSVSRFKQ